MIPALQIIRVTAAPTAEDFNRQSGHARNFADAVVKIVQRPQWQILAAIGDAPTRLQNGWAITTAAADAGSVNGFPPYVGACVDALGVVRLRGRVTGGTVAAGTTGTIVTLPFGMRPAFELVFVTGESSSVIRVLDNGDVRCSAATGGAPIIWLDGISFLAEP